MTLKSALITTATLAAIACFAGQDPRLDYSFAAPKLDGTDTLQVATTSRPVIAAQADSARAYGKTVSVTFNNAPVSQVLNWIKKQGVSFVIDESITRNKRVTLNIVNQPVSSVLDAIGAALDGHWSRRGSIYVYRPGGMTFFSSEGLTTPKAFMAPDVNTDVQKLPKMDKEWVEKMGKMPDMKGFTFAAPNVHIEDLPHMDKEWAEKMGKIPDMKGFKFVTPDMRIDKLAPMDKEWVEKMSKMHGDMKSFNLEAPKAFAYHFGPMGKDLAEKIAKEVQDALKDSKLNDQEFWEKFGKELAESLHKNLDENRPFFNELKAMPFPKMDADKMKELKVYAEGAKARSIDAEKFMASVTPAQKELQKSRGYLKVSDLTDAQREMLGIKDDQDLNLEFVIKGEKISIKGN
jgi:hypothetical protein